MNTRLENVRVWISLSHVFLSSYHCWVVCLTVFLTFLTVNLLDSRSVMGDLGWVAYPKNGVSIVQMHTFVLKLSVIIVSLVCGLVVFSEARGCSDVLPSFF